MELKQKIDTLTKEVKEFKTELQVALDLLSRFVNQSRISTVSPS
jgi:hypothetical protein